MDGIRERDDGSAAVEQFLGALPRRHAAAQQLKKELKLESDEIRTLHLCGGHARHAGSKDARDEEGRQRIRCRWCIGVVAVE